MQLIREADAVDVFNIVREMRTFRGYMVQTEVCTLSLEADNGQYAVDCRISQICIQVFVTMGILL